MRNRENTLRAARFETPERIPMVFHINAACWHHYPQEALQDLMAAHPLLFPGFVPKPDGVQPKFGAGSKAGEPYTDPWGCVWETADDGIAGTVTHHPLADWSAFESFAAPSPGAVIGHHPADWSKTAESLRRVKEDGGLPKGSLAHGHTFLLLADLRGYQNLIFDMADEDPRFLRLLRTVEDVNMAAVRRFVELGVEWMEYPEDLGMQVGPMLSPEHFVKYIKPSYQRLMAPAREAGCVIHMHSDGDIRTLVDDLVDGGVDVVNLQDLVNGIDWIKDRLAGRVCIDLDVDRQRITRFGTPREIDALIREEVEKLGSRRGGLMMIHGLYPGTPLANVKALMDAMEKYATYYS